MEKRRHSKQYDTFSALKDYAPPESIEAEQSTLGCMLIDPRCIDVVSGILRPDQFYRTGHQHVCSTLYDMADRGMTVDAITVREELKRRDLFDVTGGDAYLMALLDSVPSTAGVEAHARIVEDKANKRALIEAAMECIGLARGGDPAAIVQEQAEALIYGATQQASTESFVTIAQAMMKVQNAADESCEARHNGTPYTFGVPFGIVAIDEIVPGMQKKEVTYIAARPSMGKTSLALLIAENVGLTVGSPVVIFSMEMDDYKLALRLLSARSEINSHRIQRGELEDEELIRYNDAINDLYDAPILIADTDEMTPTAMRAALRRVQAKYGSIGLVIVDHIGLMESERRIENKVQEVAYFSRSLKKMARQFDVPVLALSQLNRAVEARKNKRPMLSDLRDSGAVEQDADNVIFLYREAYYAAKEYGGQEDDAQEQEVEVLIAKQRNGATGFVKIGFVPAFAKFLPLTAESAALDIESMMPGFGAGQAPERVMPEVPTGF